MTVAARTSRVQRWEQRTEWPLAVLALLFLVNYTVVVLDEQLSPPWRAVCKGVDYTIWALFLLDYLVRLTLATDRGRYWLTHLADLAILALPVLRPLRLLRIVILLRMLNRRAVNGLRGRMLIYVLAAGGVLVYCAALAALDAERHAPGANIVSLGDALWWAAATFCTVGYGDRFPVTGEGRAVATGLMIGGIVLVGVITASFASWLIERVRQIDEETQNATRRDVASLQAQLSRLEVRLDALMSEPSGLGRALAAGGNGAVAEDPREPVRPAAREDVLERER